MKNLSKQKKKTLLELIAVVAGLILYFSISNSSAEPEISTGDTEIIPFTSSQSTEDTSSSPEGASSLEEIPPYEGKMSIEINGNVPFFTDEEMENAAQRKYFEEYGDLDSLGRCTYAYDCLGYETMPQKGEKREDISDIHPSGWHQRSYDCIYQNTLMTRTHLAGWMLSAENANEKNLITGTRYMNSDAMLEYEEMTQDYLYHNKDKHVLYRITPVYSGDELIARGVLMEAKSVEDDGASIEYCVYVFNIQPGITFNYENGWSDYTGIFFDTTSSSVVVDGIDLDDYVMDFSTNTIHEKNCSDCTNPVPFKGDTDMVSSWEELGYQVCDCIAERLSNAA